MPMLIRISDATALAMHAMAYLAMSEGKRVNAGDLARVCFASENHMIKVCQRMVKAGFLQARRGPKGGFVLTRDPAEIRLSEIYQVFDGNLNSNHCLFETPACRLDSGSQMCIFGERMKDINRRIISYFNETRLSDIASNCHQSLEARLTEFPLGANLS